MAFFDDVVGNFLDTVETAITGAVETVEKLPEYVENGVARYEDGVKKAEEAARTLEDSSDGAVAAIDSVEQGAQKTTTLLENVGQQLDKT